MPDHAETIISIQGLNKVYATGFTALKNVSLEIKKGEIFALLGPNGAGKTTLISVVSGIVNPSSGSVKVGGYDILRDYRKTRSLIGLVPQELTTDMFAKVRDVVAFSRGMFGKPASEEVVERTLRSLSLWDKRDNRIMTLSGGMKRRVLIAKALSHEPSVLFLDEPTAGVDVALRRDMWTLVRELRASGVTIILTTHYIEEAQEMADRIGVINKGEIIVVDEKKALMRKLGKKRLTLNLAKPLPELPATLRGEGVTLATDGLHIEYAFDGTQERSGVPELLKKATEAGIEYRDLNTKESSLEEIFVSLVRN